jgi:hypothetical protein
MLERFSPSQSPEVKTPQFLHTLILFGTTQSLNGQNPALDHATRISSLAAGLLVMAGLAKMIVLFSQSPTGTTLMKKYLDDLDVPRNSLSVGKMSDNPKDEASEIEKIIKSHESHSVGIITSHSSEKNIKEKLSGAGFNLHPLSIEEEIGAKIAQSATDSRHIITELVKESVLNLLRFQKMLEEVQITKLSIR